MTPAAAPDGPSASRPDSARARNERIAQAARRHHFDHAAPVPFLCECSDARCEELLRMTLQVYAGTRVSGYVVTPGHQVDGADVVRVRDAWWVYRGSGASPGQRRSCST